MKVVSDSEHRQTMEVYPSVAIFLQIKHVHPMILWTYGDGIHATASLNNFCDELERW
jgi:hypothetical protein